MTAFSDYIDARCLEHCPSVDLMPFSATHAVTSGITALIGKSRESLYELSGKVADNLPMTTFECLIAQSLHVVLCCPASIALTVQA